MQGGRLARGMRTNELYLLGQFHSRMYRSLVLDKEISNETEKYRGNCT